MIPEAPVTPPGEQRHVATEMPVAPVATKRPARTEQRQRSLARRILSGVVSWSLRVTAAVGIVAFLGATVGQAFLPFKLLTVLTGSMSPGLPPGSLLLLTPVNAADLVVGDIIAFSHPNQPGEIVTHRIHEVKTSPDGTESFVTKGDANGSPDGWLIPAEGRGWKFRTKIPGGGPAVEFVRSPKGRLLVVTVPAMLLAGMMLLEIWRDDDDDDDNEDDGDDDDDAERAHDGSDGSVVGRDAR